MDFFRGAHPWPKLYRLLYALPPGSHYRNDQLQDEDLANHLFAQEVAAERLADLEPESDEKPDESLKTRSSVGHTMEVSLMMTMCELIQQLNSTLIAVNLPKGKKPPKVRPMPRPVGRLDVLREQRERDQVSIALDALFSDLQIIGG